MQRTQASALRSNTGRATMPSIARSTLARPARRRGDYQRPQINDGSFLRIGYNGAKRAMSSALIALYSNRKIIHHYGFWLTIASTSSSSNNIFP